MNRRKKILFLVASLIAFGIGFLSTSRPETVHNRAQVRIVATDVPVRR